MKSLSIVTAATLALAACNQSAEQTADDAANQAGAVADDAGNLASDAVEAGGNVLGVTPSGAEFANTAAKSDAFEIQSANLAVANASSQAVKDFAREMIKAHTDSTAKIKAASAKASPAITPDPTLTAEQTSNLAELKALKGADFDKAYAAAQVTAHEQALALMQGYAADGDVAPLKAAAGEIAPVVEKHLGMARDLNK
jgi:putative membrane protein